MVNRAGLAKVSRWRMRRCCIVATALKCVVSFTILILAGTRKFNRISLKQSGELVVSVDHVLRISSADNEGEARRRLLLDHANNHSGNSSKSSTGIRAALMHIPSECSSAPPGNSLSSSGNNSGNNWNRVERLKCAVQRSAKRVKYLVDKETPRGVPRKDMRKLVSDGEVVYESEVWSQPGEYLMTVGVGTPPRTVTGIVDTGSDLSWMQCQPCGYCYKQVDPIYQPRNSASYDEVDCSSKICEDLKASFCNIFSGNCDYLYSYGDDSFTYGTLSTESFTLRSTKEQTRQIPNIIFGCSHASMGTFRRTRADGVISLGQGPLSFASQLGKHSSNRFGYCLVSRHYPPRIKSPIYFGDEAILSGPGVAYTPIVMNQRHRGYYYLNMVGISLGEKRLDIPPEALLINTSTWRGGTILDSGTTVTNLNSKAYDVLVDAFNASVLKYSTISSESHFGLCYDVNGFPNPWFPQLTFHLQGVDLNLPLENYMLEAEDGVFCLAIDRSPENLTIIGNIQQQNYRVIYDRENDRIGFQATICSEA